MEVDYAGTEREEKLEGIRVLQTGISAPAAIRGHVFCSFPALVLRKEPLRRMEDKKIESEWNDIIRNLDSLTETKIETGERTSSRAARRGK